MNSEWLANLISDANYKSLTCNARGMGAKKCVAVLARAEQRPFDLLADLVRECEGIGDAASVVRDCRTSIKDGRLILYWPSAVVDDEAA